MSAIIVIVFVLFTPRSFVAIWRKNRHFFFRFDDWNTFSFLVYSTVLCILFLFQFIIFRFSEWFFCAVFYFIWFVSLANQCKSFHYNVWLTFPVLVMNYYIFFKNGIRWNDCYCWSLRFVCATHWEYVPVLWWKEIGTKRVARAGKNIVWWVWN